MLQIFPFFGGGGVGGRPLYVVCIRDRQGGRSCASLCLNIRTDIMAMFCRFIFYCKQFFWSNDVMFALYRSSLKKTSAGCNTFGRIHLCISPSIVSYILIVLTLLSCQVLITVNGCLKDPERTPLSPGKTK